MFKTSLGAVGSWKYIKQSSFPTLPLGSLCEDVADGRCCRCRCMSTNEISYEESWWFWLTMEFTFNLKTHHQEQMKWRRGRVLVVGNICCLTAKAPNGIFSMLCILRIMFRILSKCQSTTILFTLYIIHFISCVVECARNFKMHGISHSPHTIVQETFHLAQMNFMYVRWKVEEFVMVWSWKLIREMLFVTTLIVSILRGRNLYFII